MYQTIGTCAYIDGTKGKYSKKISDPSVRYGRNAINNLKGYYKDLHQKPVEFPDMKNFTSLSEEEQNKRLKQLDKATKSLKVTPMHYQCQYMPADYIDKLALMGAAYEKMGKKTCISVQEMMKNLQKEIPLGTDYPSLRFNVHSMDVNKDGAIDLSECATGILIADSLDEDGKTVLVAKDTTMNREDIKRISEAGYRMPQKSTYFYPKLLSGVVINPLK